MELQVQHENQTIILWLRSGCRTDLSMLYELGKTWRYRVVVIRSGFGSLLTIRPRSSGSTANLPLEGIPMGAHWQHPCTEEREKITIIRTFGARRF